MRRRRVGLLGLLLGRVREGLPPGSRAREIGRKLVVSGFYLSPPLHDAFMVDLGK